MSATDLFILAQLIFNIVMTLIVIDLHKSRNVHGNALLDTMNIIEQMAGRVMKIEKQTE